MSNVRDKMTECYLSTWRRTTIGREKKCSCGAKTTGRATNTKPGKEKPMCLQCAIKKGFK